MRNLLVSQSHFQCTITTKQKSYRSSVHRYFCSALLVQQQESCKMQKFRRLKGTILNQMFQVLHLETDAPSCPKKDKFSQYIFGSGYRIFTVLYCGPSYFFQGCAKQAIFNLDLDSAQFRGQRFDSLNQITVPIQLGRI